MFASTWSHRISIREEKQSQGGFRVFLSLESDPEPAPKPLRSAASGAVSVYYYGRFVLPRPCQRFPSLDGSRTELKFICARLAPASILQREMPQMTDRPRDSQSRQRLQAEGITRFPRASFRGRVLDRVREQNRFRVDRAYSVRNHRKSSPTLEDQLIYGEKRVLTFPICKLHTSAFLLGEICGNSSWLLHCLVPQIMGSPESTAEGLQMTCKLT